MKVRMRFDQTHGLAAIRGFEHGCIANQFLENAAQSVAYQGVIIDKKNFHRASALTMRIIIFDTAKEGSRHRGRCDLIMRCDVITMDFSALPEGFPAPAKQIPCPD